MTLNDFLKKVYGRDNIPTIIDYNVPIGDYAYDDISDAYFNPDMEIHYIFILRELYNTHYNFPCDYHYPSKLGRNMIKLEHEYVFSKEIHADDFTPGDLIPYDETCDDEYDSTPGEPVWIVGLLIKFNARNSY